MTQFYFLIGPCLSPFSAIFVEKMTLKETLVGEGGPIEIFYKNIKFRPLQQLQLLLQAHFYMSTPWPPCFPFYVIFGTKLAIWTRRSLLTKKCHCKNVLRIWFSISVPNFSLIRLNLKKILKFCPEGIIRIKYSWSAAQIFSSFHKFRQINLKLGTHM